MSLVGTVLSLTLTYCRFLLHLVQKEGYDADIASSDLFLCPVVDPQASFFGISLSHVLLVVQRTTVKIVHGSSTFTLVVFVNNTIDILPADGTS